METEFDKSRRIMISSPPGPGVQTCRGVDRMNENVQGPAVRLTQVDLLRHACNETAYGTNREVFSWH